MTTSSWQQLSSGWPWFQGVGQYPLIAQSEFKAPLQLVWKPYQATPPRPPDDADPWGWQVSEYEEALTLRPGLEQIARQLVSTVIALGHAKGKEGIADIKLRDNPYWPPQLARRAGRLAHERYVVLLPLALSRTQDDKSRKGWTLFGASEQGPARAFWRSFFTAPDREMPEEQALGFIRRLLNAVYDEADKDLDDLRQAGFRILPRWRETEFPYWREGPLPRWTRRYLWKKGQRTRDVKYLLTFRPFGELPAQVRKAYVAGDLHLLPFPGSLFFWGAPPYRRLQQQLPFAMQIPLLQLVQRHEGPHGIRVPQSGWFQEPTDGAPARAPAHGPWREEFHPVHRHNQIPRDQDDLAIAKHHVHVACALFSTDPQDLGLYNKPAACNAQLWTRDYQLVLDGPQASRDDLRRAAHRVADGGLFGYRFQYPAMRVGEHEIYWQRPLVAYLSFHTGQPAVLPEAPLGYLTAYRADRPNLARPIELWPRLLQRDLHVAAIGLFEHAPDERPHQTLLNIQKFLDTQHLLSDRPLDRDFARCLLTLRPSETVDNWLDSLPAWASDPERGRWFADQLRQRLQPDKPKRRPSERALTYRFTARRSFEVAYWNTIAELSTGAFANRNNFDCIHDPPTQAAGRHPWRDLDALAQHLLARYRQLVQREHLIGEVMIGDLPFRMETQFDYSWSGGWADNRADRLHERDLIVVIPGRDHSRAIIMADHYDTAYMSDRYEKEQGGDGARLAAPGADDNSSATAALLLGAPIFLQLSRAGRLACDIWLVHLTGEEFPADSLGARQLCQRLVEGNLRMRLEDGSEHDLSRTRIQGVFVLDMIAHNTRKGRNIFQIAPGSGPAAMELAYQAHLATQLWNASVPRWNRRPSRRSRPPGRLGRSQRLPPIALHPQLRGEVRPRYDPRSTLYNADARIFSDAGIPAVLFMENYDLSRSGYHDSQDTMANISLDYGAALVAIAIETVARVATREPPGESKEGK